MLVCQRIYFPVYSVLPFKPMEERAANDVIDRGTAEGATPATAQAQEPLAQANLESAGITGHRRGTQREL